MTRPSSISRRTFVHGAVAAVAAVPLVLRAQASEDDLRLFRHGVASGDPLSDRVVLWSRVTPPPTRSAIGPIQVRWQVATNERMTEVVAAGTTEASPARDFTVKVDAGNLRPGRTYYYAFDAGGQQSAVGRTRTLANDAERIRLASVSCSNYSAGYFNVYRCLAKRDDLDLVVHLGDYIYEFANGVYGDGDAIGREPQRRGEAVTLNDYRARYATYRTDIDLQAAHQTHPFVAVWDDHEVANDAWSGGAGSHTSAQGSWANRRRDAWRAYLEWMPVRESPGPGIQLYRSFRIGGLADLVMLDTRTFRDEQAGSTDTATLANPQRTMLGDTQEAWLYEQLKGSRNAATAWRLVGQQVVFAPITPPGMAVLQVDAWDGYPAARGRLLDYLVREKIGNVAFLTGDIHSSWAIDVPREPLFGYQASTGAGSLAVEIVTPAISSPPLFSIEGIKERVPLLRLAAPHVRYLDGERRGYTLLDITADRLIAEWHHVATVTERSDREQRSARYVCEKGAATMTMD